MSSAHINSFQQNGVIVIRNVLSTDGSEATHLSRAVACRLMGAPACCAVASTIDSSTNECVYYYFSDRYETTLGFDVGPGDILVVASDIARSENVNWIEGLVSCQADDDSVLFTDTLFGTRGETPTTVIQWSKGTIF